MELLKVNDKFYFSVDQSSKELWESDGTILGTKVIEANLGTSFSKHLILIPLDHYCIIQSPNRGRIMGI